MEAVVIKLLNMSIAASYLALAVMVLRLVLKKAPRWLFVALWAMVGLRLLLPFSWQSAMSLQPSAQPIPQTIVTDPVPKVNTGIPVFNNAINPMLETSFTPAPGESVNPMQVFARVAGYVYLAGVVLMALYTAFSYLRLKVRVREAVKKEGRIYLCDRIPSPFILGLFSPKIYLPSSMAEEDIPFVVAHEKAHIRRCDHIWKPLGFALLSFYWFNPILWVSYILLCRDIETACDEKVITLRGVGIKRAYCEALLNSSVSRRTIAACPLAFGETGVKARIKNVLSYKKPAFWIILIALIAGIVVGICLLTDPPKDSPKPTEPVSTTLPEPSGQEPLAPEAWFDYESHQTAVQTATLPEYPGLTFEATSYAVTQFQEGGRTDVVFGMPIQNVYLCDVTGDGKREICASVSFGSGMIDGHIVIYDIAASRRAYIWDRGITDYRLGVKDGQLYIESAPYGEESNYTPKVPLLSKDVKLYLSQDIWEDVKPYSLASIPIYDSIDQFSAIEKFPQYVGMDVSQGMTIYVWQMAKENYCCVPVPDKNHVLSDIELMRILQMPQANLEEMRAILTTYGLSEANIRVEPIRAYHSSYHYTIDENYTQDIRNRLFLDN